jgi:hypothetical protein
MTDAMTDVTDEFIAEMSRSDVDTNIRSMAREIQRRRASDDAKDAERYRWLRDNTMVIDHYRLGGSELDAAIDSSMGAEHG